MTAKEKAKQLVQKFFDEISDHMQWDQAKECALYVVDEIIQEISHGLKRDWIKERQDGDEFIIYWNAVKDEINAL